MLGRLPLDPQCETKNASPNLTFQYVKSKPLLKKINQYLLTIMLNYIIYVWMGIWVIGISGGQITPWQGHNLWGLCHMNLLSGPENWVLWECKFLSGNIGVPLIWDVRILFFTILHKFLGAEFFRTLSLLKYDVFQVIKILFPTISLNCKYLQTLSVL